MRRRFQTPQAGVALLGALLVIAQPADACSTLYTPWELRGPRMISFVGSPLPDTVRAGPGSMLAVGFATSGAETSRAIFGQRVRVDQIGDAARRLMPRNVKEVVLVPWSYGGDCQPIPWGASTRWLSESRTGLFRATLRNPEFWANGLPTFDILTTRDQPYQERAVVPGQQPRLSTDALLRFYDLLPNNGEESDSAAALEFIKLVRADSVLRSSFPSRTFLHHARTDINNARLLGVRVPVGGTYRIEATIHGDTRAFYLRTTTKVASLQHWARGDVDTALVPRDPEGYYVQAAAAMVITQLAESCHSRVNVGTGSVLAYVDLDWHGTGVSDTAREWKGGLDQRLLEAVLSDEERVEWRQRMRDSATVRMQQRRALADSLRRAASSANAVSAPATAQPFIFIAQRPLRIWTDASGTLRIEGVMQIDQLGPVTFRGERLSLDALPCS